MDVVCSWSVKGENMKVLCNLTGQGCFRQEFEGSAEGVNLKVDLEATMKGSRKDRSGHIVLSKSTFVTR